MKLSLATRGSELALWQAHHVAARLGAAHPELQVSLLVVRTTGDRVQDRALSSIGGTGVFTREVDRAVLTGEADAAVHSLKDLPTQNEPGLAIAAVLERGDPRDAFLPAAGAPRTLHQLPSGARVGTSSLRRRALLLERRPDLVVEEFRGNLDTRLDRLARGDLDGAVLALAGVQRIGRMDAVGEVLEPPAWLPAAGQGALAVVVRATDAATQELLQALEHKATRRQVTAERRLLELLRGGCQVPLGALATTVGGRLTMHAFVGSPDGRQCLRASAHGTGAAPEAAAEELAALLEAQGAASIVARMRAAHPPLPQAP